MKSFSLFASAIVIAASPLSAQTVAITGGTVALGDGSAPIPNGVVVIQNGKIVGAGSTTAIPRGAEIVDARGKWVTPGIVGGFSRLGLSEVDLSAEGTTDDNAPGSPFSAALDVAPAINPMNSTISVNREDGVTRAIVAPNVGRTIFGG
ncbi:MAG: amidohydrolase, partial [Sphingomicrobium sp.]